MSRKYLNDRFCIRCGRMSPTPYLRKNIDLFKNEEYWKRKVVVDIGCGNGRNTVFMRKQGFRNVIAMDMAADFGEEVVLGHQRLPVSDDTADVILANYLFMFLDAQERDQLIHELKRIARPGCYLMVELYPAKCSETPTREESARLQQELFEAFSWAKVRYSQDRFIARNILEHRSKKSEDE